MPQLRIKLKINNLELELEGSEETVLREWDHLIGQHIRNITQYIEAETNISAITKPKADKVNATLPPLTNIPILKPDLTEKEWIAIYSFYAKQEGKAVMTRKDYVNMYQESGRKDLNRLKNLSRSIESAIKEKGLAQIRSGEYSITELGENKVKKLLMNV